MAQKVLLVQDDPADARAVREALSNPKEGPFRVQWVKRCFDGLGQLVTQGKQDKNGNNGIAAVVADLILPDSQGIETFNFLFQAAPQIPILVLCASQDEAVAKLTVQHGAQDYLLKHHLDSYVLPKAVRSMVERAAIAEALSEEKERTQATLDSIGDAVVSTDLHGHVTYLNAVAERMTGWSRKDANGMPAEEVFGLIDGTTRRPVQNPMSVAIRKNSIVALTPDCVLIGRDGGEVAIEDSAAPIYDRSGQISGAVMVFHDVSAARAVALQMSYLAQYDSLTDRPNRVLFNDRLTQAIALSHRQRRKLAVLYLDIDRFKQINDSLGHPVGDRLLQSVAMRLRDCVRASDTVSRQGSDEFVILLPELPEAKDAAVTADKILLALSSSHYIDRHDLHISASIGIVIYPDDGTLAETLLTNADFAMYHAKESGRNNYQFFKSDMNVRAIERQTVEDGLRRAVKRREFLLVYQPQIDLDQRAVVGVEALIRWNHPERGLTAPVHFIPVAEDCGVIVPIGRWVMREACFQARAWQDAGLRSIPVAVNISAAELVAKDFVAAVRAILLESGLDPSFLELELTETFLMQDPSPPKQCCARSRPWACGSPSTISARGIQA